MNKFGVQYFHKSLRIFDNAGIININSDSIMQHKEIKEVLRQFQAGYTERNIEKADNFVEELFINGENTCVLGTGTGELFLGSEQVKTLIRDDWQYWGDVNINWENPHISTEGEVAWFATQGTVKYSFEDTPERYESYINFFQKKADEKGLTPKQKITFINWVLALTYHQRLEKSRAYQWPLRLSGVLLKEADKWKFVHLQFSIPKANFPDERFENSKEYLDSYIKQNEMTVQVKSNQITVELKDLLKSLEKEFIGKKNISKDLVSKYFVSDSLPYIIGGENQWYYGTEQISEFFEGSGNSTLSLDLDHAIASKSEKVTWVTVTGILKQDLTEEELAELALEELGNLFKADIASKEKLFAVHRSIAYALKESAAGANYNCPIRLTAVILNKTTGPAFQSIHFSFPSYWIFEGKVDEASYEEKMIIEI